MKTEPKICWQVGAVFWLIGLSLIGFGYSQFAWLPISIGSFANGYLKAIRDGALSPADRGTS
jgi:hypothetical protein